MTKRPVNITVNLQGLISKDNNMTQARDIAKRLRVFLNSEKLTLSDLRRGMVVLSNGKLRGQGRSSILGHPGASTAKRSVIKGLAEVSC